MKPDFGTSLCRWAFWNVRFIGYRSYSRSGAWDAVAYGWQWHEAMRLDWWQGFIRSVSCEDKKQQLLALADVNISLCLHRASPERVTMKRNIHKVTPMSLPHIVTFHGCLHGKWQMLFNCVLNTDIFACCYVVWSAYCTGHTTTFSHQGHYGCPCAM